MTEVEDEKDNDIKFQIFDMFQSCLSTTKRQVNDLSYRSSKNSLI